MKVEKILAQKGTDIYTIQPNSRISEAAKRMNEKHVGALMVLDGQQNIMGIISERDILRAVAKEDFQGMLVKDTMTPKAKLIMSSKDNDLRYVMSVMAENKIRHLPIMEDGKLAALISIRDVVKTLLEHAEYEKEIMTDYMSGTDLD